MNVISKRALAHALFASFIAAAIPAYAADTSTPSGKSTDAAKSGDTMMSKDKVKKAFHRMMDKIEGNKTESASDKQARRDKQFEIFWKELMTENRGG
jgi:hypothetical protein